jgi:orotate phosphoribosyltransferase
MSLIIEPSRALEILSRTGAYREGHFEYPSGFHTPHYFQMPLALRYSDNARVLSVSLSRLLRGSRELVRALPHVAVVAPGSGGIPVAFEIREVFGAEQIFWAEREGGEVRFRQYVEITPGLPCLIVDDIVRTGDTMRRVHRLLTDAGAHVLAIGALVRFSSADLAVEGAPVYSLVNFETARYASAAECPLCAEGVPVEEVRF